MKNLDTFFDRIFRLVVTIAAIWAAYVLSSIFLAPPAFETKVVQQPVATTLCYGATFTYSSETIVRRTPVTLIKTETWFGEAQRNNVITDTFADVEIINWDKKVPAIIPRTYTIAVPKYDRKGRILPPGNYRYITNIQSWGDPKTASLSFDITIPKDCS
jgi:hypothetical protein